MSKLEQNNQERKKISPIGIDEVSSQLEVLRNREFVIDKKGGEYIIAVTKIRNEFVKKLLSEKERFSRIFRTSSGSIYFQVQTGETLRAKMMPDKYEFEEGDGKHYKFQPITTDLFFIPQSEIDRLNGVELYPGEKIRTVPFGIGVSPFELNIRGFGSKVVFEEGNGGLFLIGTQRTYPEADKTIEMDHNLVGGIHKGHPIVEIII